VVFVMYMQEGEGRALSAPALNFAVGLTALATVVFAIVPGPLMQLATNAVMVLAH